MGQITLSLLSVQKIRLIRSLLGSQTTGPDECLSLDISSVNYSGARFTKHLKPKIFISYLKLYGIYKSLKLMNFSEMGARLRDYE